MLFNSYFFLLYFFPIFIICYLVFHKWITLANLAVVCFSLIFYASFGLWNVPILLVPLIVQYTLGNTISSTNNKQIKHIIAAIAIIMNLLILGYFKYFNFVTDTLYNMVGVDMLKTSATIIAPIGISFITFQRISYIIDILRGKIKPATNIIAYATYDCLFPHLISGPIVRYALIKTEVAKRKLSSLHMFEGGKYFAVGLFLKVCIADQLFSVENALTESLYNLHFFDSLLLLLVFSLRIYCDFSGYSLMAIGIAKFVGFNFPQNFDSPYRSASITEFWRRWNITLSNWLRDYLYIPLGGNRKGAARRYLNLLITMLLAGLWHGASWNFLVWGGLHGTYLVIERSMKNRINIFIPSIVKQILTFSLVTLTWTTFKFTDVRDILHILKNIFLPEFLPIIKINHSLLLITPFLLIAVLWAFVVGEKGVARIQPSLVNSLIISVIFIAAIISSFVVKTIPFIYAQF